MSARKIICLINPIAGTRSKKGIRTLVEKRLSVEQIPFVVLPTVADGNYSFVIPYVLDQGYTDIVIAGGDGTVRMIVEQLMHLPVQFGIIPCGSGNGLALAAGISRKPEQALEIILTGKAKTIDGFYLNSEFSCMLAGLGFDAKVAHDFADQPKRGLKTYVSLISKHFMSTPTWSFEIESNSVKFTTEAFFISIANSNQFGNNFTIAPEARLSDGLLDVVIVKKNAKPMMLLSILKQVFTGKTRKVDSSLNLPVIYFQTPHLKIINKGKAPLHIDGDPAETPDQIEAKIHPACFRLIHPLSTAE